MTDARTLTQALGGRWANGSGMCCCPAHEDRRPSLSIKDGDKGYPVFNCFKGCDYRDVKDALRRRGLITGRSEARRPDLGKAEQRRREEEARNVKRRRQALDVWRRGQPIAGTPAERYLRHRGITCALPDTLRYVKDCWHQSAKRLPALVGAITMPEGAIGGVQRIYLTEGGAGKAKVVPAKAMLGQAAGGAVRLYYASGPLVVAEGIETALSLLSGLFPRPASVWAALSTSGMGALHLPTVPGELVIAPDGDPAGRQAADKLAHRADGLGWRVSLLPPPDGLDWNDVLNGKGVAA